MRRIRNFKGRRLPAPPELDPLDRELYRRLEEQIRVNPVGSSERRAAIKRMAALRRRLGMNARREP